MKKILTSFLIVAILALSFTGCADRKTINGTEYDTYGLFDEGKKANPNIEYELVWGNIVWGVILVQTLIAPIYFFGFALWEPVGVQNNNPALKGVMGNTNHITPTSTTGAKEYPKTVYSSEKK